MARPVMTEEEKRSTHIEFRMTSDVMERLKAAATKKGMTVNALARCWIHERLDEEPRPKKSKVMKDLMKCRNAMCNPPKSYCSECFEKM